MYINWQRYSPVENNLKCFRCIRTRRNKSLRRRPQHFYVKSYFYKQNSSLSTHGIIKYYFMYFTYRYWIYALRAGATTNFKLFEQIHIIIFCLFTTVNVQTRGRSRQSAVSRGTRTRIFVLIMRANTLTMLLSSKNGFHNNYSENWNTWIDSKGQKK